MDPRTCIPPGERRTATLIAMLSHLPTWDASALRTREKAATPFCMPDANDNP